MFVGRTNELDKLEAGLLQTKAGQSLSFMLTGERGIGKTSLLEYLRAVATGGIDINSEYVSFLVVETDIDQRTTQTTLVRKIELGLRTELEKTEKARLFLKGAWNFLQRVEAGGFSLKEHQKSDAEVLVEEFAYSLAETVKRTTAGDSNDTFGAKYDGLLLLIDEADNSSTDLGLGSFLKLLMERLQRRGCEKVMVVLAGLPELRQVLLQSHPSSLRIFEELPLDRLSSGEVKSVVAMGISQGNKNNTEQTTITDEAKDVLVNLSEGYPHFIQQFGYCAFAADQDFSIDAEDVKSGAFGRRGGLEMIGDRYYRNDFYNKIQKDSYRQVLRIMAEKHDGWISKAEIKAAFDGKESTLDNAIHALRERHIILSQEGQRGVYRLQHRGFALWIKLYTADKSHLEQPGLHSFD
jgi:AAA ATPase domain